MSARLRWAALIALACGCAFMPPSVSVPPREMSAALTAWRQAGLPAGDCLSTARDVRKVLADPSLVTELCRAPKGVYAGCYTVLGGGFLGVLGSQPAIIIGEAYDTTQLDEHELTHWLAVCSGYDPTGDSNHRDPLLWGPGGTKERAIDLALAM
jgi:hypothetical protein